jgi:hypothetical protein
MPGALLQNTVSADAALNLLMRRRDLPSAVSHK